MNTSSKAAAAAAALLLAGGIGLAATTPHRAAPPLGASTGAHSLQSVLREYDRQIAALRATLHPAAFENSTAAIDAAGRGLRAEVADASAEIDRVVAQRAGEYAARQDEAVSAVLSSAGASAPSRSDVARHVEDAYRAEYSALRSGAESDMNAYQRAVQAQERQDYAAFAASVQRRTQQAFFNRAQELRERESTLLLDLARKDAAQRMNLRAKLQTLALGGDRRAQLLARLAAIQAAEDRAVEAARSRDAATLESYRSALLAQAGRDLGRMSVQLQSRAQSNLAARRDVLAAQRAQSGTLPLGSSAPANANGPDLRAAVAALRAQGAQRFRADAQSSIAAYAAAGDDIASRFAYLRTQDAASLQSTLDAIAALQRDRAQLAAQLASH